MTSATATNVGLRNEHRLDHLDTRFMQVTLDGSHSFSEAFKVHTLLGWSESHHRNPIQTTLAADLGCAGTGTAIYTCGAGTTATRTASPEANKLSSERTAAFCPASSESKQSTTSST